jgi:vacuolar-type H+-ATPase subunit D/Vma8
MSPAQMVQENLQKRAHQYQEELDKHVEDSLQVLKLASMKQNQQSHLPCLNMKEKKRLQI